MPEINLLQNAPSAKKSSEANSVLPSTLNYIGLAVLVVIVAATGFLYYADSQASAQAVSVTSQVSAAKSSITSNPSYGLFLTDQISSSALQNLLQSHVDWSQLPSRFGSVTLKTVSYSDMDITQDGTAKLSGFAPDFNELDKYLKALSDHSISPFVDSAVLNSVSLSSGTTAGLNFTVTVTFDKSIWSTPQ